MNHLPMVGGIQLKITIIINTQLLETGNKKFRIRQKKLGYYIHISIGKDSQNDIF